MRPNKVKQMMKDGKPVINGWGNDQISKKRGECIKWWRDFKNKLQDSIKLTINL